MRADSAPVGGGVLRLVMHYQALAGAVVGERCRVVAGQAEPISDPLDQYPSVRSIACLSRQRAAEAAGPIGRKLSGPLHRSIRL